MTTQACACAKCKHISRSKIYDGSLAMSGQHKGAEVPMEAQYSALLYSSRQLGL